MIFQHCQKLHPGIWTSLLCAFLWVGVVACSTQTDQITAHEKEPFTIELSADRTKGERWIWNNAQDNPTILLDSIEYTQKVTITNQSGGLEKFIFVAKDKGTYVLTFSVSGKTPRQHQVTVTIQ